MTRQQLLELMREAGFSTEWAAYQNARETLEKYERFADLIGSQMRTTPPSEMANLAQKALWISA